MSDVDPAAAVADPSTRTARPPAVVRCIYRQEHAFIFRADRGDQIYFACPGGPFYVCARHQRRYDAIIRPGGIWEQRLGRERMIELRTALILGNAAAMQYVREHIQ